MLNRVQSLSKDAPNEAVIFLAHGDPERDGFWAEVLKNVDKYTKEHTKINYVDHALIEMGHDFANIDKSFSKEEANHSSGSLSDL